MELLGESGEFRISGSCKSGGPELEFHLVIVFPFARVRRTIVTRHSWCATIALVCVSILGLVGSGLAQQVQPQQQTPQIAMPVVTQHPVAPTFIQQPVAPSFVHPVASGVTITIFIPGPATAPMFQQTTVPTPAAPPGFQLTPPQTPVFSPVGGAATGQSFSVPPIQAQPRFQPVGGGNQQLAELAARVERLEQTNANLDKKLSVINSQMSQLIELLASRKTPSPSIPHPVDVKDKERKSTSK